MFESVCYLYTTVVIKVHLTFEASSSSILADGALKYISQGDSLVNELNNRHWMRNERVA